MYAAMIEDAAERRRWTFYEAVRIGGRIKEEAVLKSLRCREIINEVLIRATYFICTSHELSVLLVFKIEHLRLVPEGLFLLYPQ